MSAGLLNDFVVAQLQVEPLFEETGIPLALIGMFVVFVALILMSGVIQLLPSVLALITREQEASAEVPQLLSDEMSEETLVVIAAAVHEILKKPHRIVTIRGADDQTWSLEGRLNHLQSHSLRRGGK